METAKHILVLIIGIALVTTPIQSTEQPQAKLSNTRTASCIVKVTCDPVVLPLSFATIDFLLHSSSVDGKAIREVLDILPDHVPYNHLTIRYLEENSARTRKTTSTDHTITAATDFPMNEQIYLFSLNIELHDDVKAAAEEFMDALLQNLRSELTRAFEEPMQRLRNQLKFAADEAALAEQELNTKQRHLRRNFGSRILDRTRILADIENIRKDIQKVKIEQAADQANIDETTRQIAKIQAGMQEETSKDTVTAELTTLLQLQQLNVANMKKLSDGGRASSAEFADAMEKLTRTRIELAQRREQLSKSAGGNLIDSLNSALVNCSIKTTQNQAKLVSLDEQLKEARPLLEKADASELLSLKIDIAKQNFQETILWRDRMNRQVRIIQPPMVSVIGGD